MLRFLLLADDDAHAAERFDDPGGTAAGARVPALHRQALADAGFRDDEAVDVEIVVVLGIGDRRGEHLLHVARHRLGREAEDAQRLLGPLAADQAGDEIELLRRAADLSAHGQRLVLGDPAGSLLFAHGLPLALLVGRMARKEAGRSELAQLHADHVLVDGHRHELAAVIDVERQPDELRQHGGAARPGLDRGAATGFLRRLCLLQQGQLDERTFPDGAGHLLPLLLRVTRTDDHLVRRLVLAGAGALGRLAPGRDRVTAARRPAFAAAVRVVDRVLGDAAGERTLAHPAGAAGLGEILVLVVRVRDRADGAHAVRADVALLARVQAHDHHAAVAADDLDVGAGRTRDLAALARLHLDIVDDGADRHLAELHRIARLHVDLAAGDDGVARTQALRRQDVGDLAVLILDQGDERGAVRIIFEPLYGGRHVPLPTLEVDIAVALLVAAGDAARRHMALVVAAAGLALAFGQRLDRLALPERRLVDQDQAALRRGGRVILLECHRSRLRYRW